MGETRGAWARPASQMTRRVGGSREGAEGRPGLAHPSGSKVSRAWGLDGPAGSLPSRVVTSLRDEQSHCQPFPTL